MSVDTTAPAIAAEQFTQALLFLLDETFEHVHGVFLDRGTSLFETLQTISAEEASIPVGGRCATLAAQVAHVAFYLDVAAAFIRGENPGRVDWGEIWARVKGVTPEEWAATQAALRESYRRIIELAQASTGAWAHRENAVAGAMGLVAHTAYHLGEIRQALCALKV